METVVAHKNSEVIKKILMGTCNGIAQVTFINNWKYGLIVGLCIALLDPLCGLTVFLGSFLSCCFSWIVWDEEYTVSGAAAFNTVILFLIIQLLFGGLSSVWLVLPITVLCMMTVYGFKYVLDKFDLGAFSVPAVVVAYVLVFVAKSYPDLFHSVTPNFIYTFTQSINFGILQHFIVNLGDVYLQNNAIFALVLMLCYVAIKREYLIYITSSFIFAYSIYYFINSFIYPVDLNTFFTFNVILGLMGISMLGWLSLNKYLLLKIFCFTLAVIIVEIILGNVLQLIGLPILTMPFMIVIYLVFFFQRILLKNRISETKK